jgi:hypothetical protein
MNLQGLKKTLSGDSLRDLRRAAKKHRVHPDTLLWMLCDVDNDGRLRSRAHADAPQHVIEDGVINPRYSEMLHFMGWEWSAKGREILAKTGQHVEQEA